VTEAGDSGKKSWDLEERTARFGENVILLAQKIRETAVTRRLVSQLVGAATSIGANYCEADDSVSGKDFHHKAGICRKESHETMHWLRMIAVAVPDVRDEARVLWKKAKELNLIFGVIYRGKGGAPEDDKES